MYHSFGFKYHYILQSRDPDDIRESDMFGFFMFGLMLRWRYILEILAYKNIYKCNQPGDWVDSLHSDWLSGN